MPDINAFVATLDKGSALAPPQTSNASPQDVKAFASTLDKSSSPTAEKAALTGESHPIQNLLQGFNTGYEKARNRTVALLGKGLDFIGTGAGAPIKTEGQNPVSQFANYLEEKTQPSEQLYEVAKMQNPYMAGAGNFAGGLVSNATVGAPLGLAAGLGKAAAVGSSMLGDVGAQIGGAVGGTPGAIAGGLAGGALGIGIGNMLGNAPEIAKGLQLAFSNERLPEALTKATMLRGGSAQVPAANEVADTMRSAISAAKEQKNALYAVRNEYAKDIGALVTERNALSDLVTGAQKQLRSGSTEAARVLYREARNVLGDGSPISYKKAMEQVKDLGSASWASFGKGESSIAQSYNTIKDAILADMKANIKDPHLMSLTQRADNYYSTVYAPLKESLQKMPAYTDMGFVDKFLRGLPKDSAYGAGYDLLPANAKQQLFNYHLNSLEQASLKNGLVNPTKYASLLKTQLEQANASPLIRDRAADLGVLADALEAVGKGKGAFPSLGHSTGQATAVGLGAGTAFGSPALGATMAGMYGIFKGSYLTAAGRALSNASISGLIKEAKRLPSTVDPLVKSSLLNKIGTAALAGTIGAVGTYKVMGSSGKGSRPEGTGDQEFSKQNLDSWN